MNGRLFVSDGRSVVEAELIGLAEAAELAGISRPRVHELYRLRRPLDLPFPEPIVRLSAGPVWHKPDVAAWVNERARRRAAATAERERRRREVEERLAAEPPSDGLAAAARSFEETLEELRQLTRRA